MPSFDIVSKIDHQEVDNAINSVNRELSNRYDFKGAKFSIELDIKESQITVNAQDKYKLGAISDSIKTFIVKRGLDAKALEFKDPESASGNSLRQLVKVKNGIDQETAKKIVKRIKDSKLKVQTSIRGEEVRIEGKKINDLQDIISLIKSGEFEIPLQFINFRD